MNNIISNSYMPKFTGLRYNTSLKKAKEYANSTNQNEIFKKARELVDNLSGDNLKITVRKNKYPEKCLHVSVLNKDLMNKFIGGVDYLHSGTESVGKVTFDVLKNLADKTTNIHKIVFNK